MNEFGTLLYALDHGMIDLAYIQPKVQMNTRKEILSKHPYKKLGFYLKKAVTEGISFINLKSRYSIPCERDMFYNRYRKFFWLLSRAKD